MRLFAIFLFIVGPLVSSAEELGAFSMYEEKFLLPRVLLPFHVSGTLMSDEIRSEIKDLNTNNCQMMQDPFIKSNFLLKCLDPGIVEISFSVKRNNVIYKIQPLAISIVDPGNIIIPENPKESPELQMRAQGKQIYLALCSSCHSTMKLNLIENKTVAQLENAFLKSEMSNFSSQLNRSDLEKLELFFKTISESEKKGTP